MATPTPSSSPTPAPTMSYSKLKSLTSALIILKTLKLTTASAKVEKLRKENATHTALVASLRSALPRECLLPDLILSSRTAVLPCLRSTSSLASKSWATPRTCI